MLAVRIAAVYNYSHVNYSSFSEVSFAFALTPALIASGIGYALLLGLIGGLTPAIRAARQPITIGLREA